MAACTLLLGLLSTARAQEGSVSSATAAPTGADRAGALAAAASLSEPGARHREPRPFLHPSLGDEVRSRLEAGLELAVARLDALPECRALFAALGADGADALDTTMYFPVAPHRKVAAVCRGRNVAVTFVGAPSTFLCPEFAQLSDEHAAMYLLHEALHHAGLPEQPLDRSAMTSREINALVTHRCGL